MNWKIRSRLSELSRFGTVSIYQPSALLATLVKLILARDFASQQVNAAGFAKEIAEMERILKLGNLSGYVLEMAQTEIARTLEFLRCWPRKTKSFTRLAAIALIPYSTDSSKSANSWTYRNANNLNPFSCWYTRYFLTSQKLRQKPTFNLARMMPAICLAKSKRLRLSILGVQLIPRHVL